MYARQKKDVMLIILNQKERRNPTRSRTDYNYYSERLFWCNGAMSVIHRTPGFNSPSTNSVGRVFVFKSNQFGFYFQEGLF